MKKRLTKVGAIALVMLALVSMLAMPSSAYIAYNTYNYNYYGEAIETPSGYAPETIYYGEDLGVGTLSNAVDLYVSPQNEIYILDYFGSENLPRLHIFDSNFKHIKTLSTLTANGNPYIMKLPESVVVDKFGYIYICDTGNRQILKLDKDKSGKIVQTVGAPNSDLFEGEFKPSKIAIAKNMSLYVICTGALDGIMEFDERGTFLRYFGAPDVQMSVTDMIALAWRRMYRSILGSDADDSFATFVPTEFSNLVVDDFGFVYSVIAATEDSNTEQLLKMNFLGNNILDPMAKSTQKVSDTLSKTYGDLQRRGTKTEGNIFTDVAVDKDGFITMLDSNLCKVFEYDPEGNLTFVYSGKGSQKGMLNRPAAIAKLGKKTLILDSHFGSITIFDLTQYGDTLHDGIMLYDQGLYTDAETYWNVILKQNANCELAHIGLGKVYYQFGRYKDAIHHFKIANDRMNYQDTYALYREAVIADYFDLIMTLLVVLVVVAIVWKVFGKKILEMIKNRKQGGGEDESEIME